MPAKIIIPLLLIALAYTNGYLKVETTSDSITLSYDLDGLKSGGTYENIKGAGTDL